MRSPTRSPSAKLGRGREYDRHSGTGTRGLPKKNGAGGKGVWGAEMDQMPITCLDKNDPNYDSDAEPAAELDVAPPPMELNPTPAGEEAADAKVEGEAGTTPASSTTSVPSPNASD